jgi:hypothetical protein
MMLIRLNLLVISLITMAACLVGICLRYCWIFFMCCNLLVMLQGVVFYGISYAWCLSQRLVLQVGDILSFNGFQMDTNNGHRNRQWKILCWNIRGIIAQSKLTAIRSKIKEANCDIICLQETKKKKNFDLNFIKSFCPMSFDRFEFIPSIGAS